MPSTAAPLYDAIGSGYTNTRQADPRVTEALLDLLALPSGSTIADIGAGTGNYTRALADRGYFVEAVEPSALMRGQAVGHPGVRWHEGVAERLPLADCAVQGCVSTLAVHHFTEIGQALREMTRVAGNGPLVFLTFDYRQIKPLWLADYFPNLWKAAVQSMPPLEEVAAEIESGTKRNVDIVPFLLPPDLSDLFLAAPWRRPRLYLDPAVRAGMSIFAVGDCAEIEAGVLRLQTDLGNGTWNRQYGRLRDFDEIDAGYRFLLVKSQ